MKKSIMTLLMLTVVTIFLTGCKEKKIIDLSDGGDPTKAPTAQVTPETPTPTPTPDGMLLKNRGSFGDGSETVWLSFESCKIDSDGRLMVVLTVEGYGFDGNFELNAGQIEIPYIVEAKYQRESYSYVKAVAETGKITYWFDLCVIPENLTAYDRKNPSSKYSFSVRKAESTETTPTPTPSTPTGWTTDHENFDYGDVAGFEDKTYDEKGRLRILIERKRSTEYGFALEFRMYYTYTDGSNEVIHTEECVSYDLYDWNVVTHKGRATGTYQMESPDNRIELYGGWSETDEFGADGVKRMTTDGCNGSEFTAGGEKVKDIPHVDLIPEY